MKFIKKTVLDRIRETYQATQRIEEKHKTSPERGEEWLAEQKASSKTQQRIDKIRAAFD